MLHEIMVWLHKYSLQAKFLLIYRNVQLIVSVFEHLPLQNRDIDRTMRAHNYGIGQRLPPARPRVWRISIRGAKKGQGKINMARITVEDCLQKVNNRFMLIHMAAKRVRQLRKGDEPTIHSKNRDIVVSLREIAAGNVSALAEQPQEEPREALSESLSASTEEETSPDIQEKEVETSEGN